MILKITTLKISMNRRNFLYFLIAGASTNISSNLLSSCSSDNLSLLIENNQKDMIDNFNALRKDQLANNFSYQVKEDYLNNRTIWIGRRIYTFAEFSKL